MMSGGVQLSLNMALSPLQRQTDPLFSTFQIRVCLSADGDAAAADCREVVTAVLSKQSTRNRLAAAACC